MARDRLEQRFVDFTRFVLPGREVGQEVSLPRKTRRLDAVFHIEDAPGLFGPLGPWLSHRPVIFEHESGLVPEAALRRALVGETWMSWRQVVARGRASKWGTPSRADDWLKEIEGSPTVVVVVEQLRTDAIESIPNMMMLCPGGWHTPQIRRGGMIVLDVSKLPEQDGYSYWRLTIPAPTAEERERRVLALRTDEHLPIAERQSLLKAIAMKQIPTTLEEKRVAFERQMEEAHSEGQRESLLALASRLVPTEVTRLRRLSDLASLERELVRLLETRTN